MFGKKKASEHNVLLLDIENASVGVALAHINQAGKPTLFGEHRTHLSMPRTLSGSSIAGSIERAAHEAVIRLSEVAARLRGNKATAQKGELTGASIFMGAPWGVPNLAKGASDFSPRMQAFLANEIEAIAPDVPVTFYTGADAASFSAGKRAPVEGPVLLALLRGEIIELVLLGEGGALGYGTLPVGTRSLYRTLQTHGGLSLAEVPSILALSKNYAGTGANPYREPLEAAGRHMLEHFGPGVEALVHSAAPEALVVVGDEPIADWFARTLENDESLGVLFAPGSIVRTFGAGHAVKSLGGHATSPDLHLALDALFVEHKLTGAGSGI